MATINPDTPRLEQPLAEFERRMIDDFVRTAGYDPAEMRTRTDAAARAVLSMASAYAAGKLTEVESRMHYLRSLRGQE
jgi:hypothetical protein